MALDKQTRNLGLIFLLLSVAILVIGLQAYRAQATHLKDIHLHDLEAVAELKVDLIADWLAERRANVVSASGNPTIANAAADWLASGDDAARERLAGFLRNFRQAYNFASTELRDLDGRLLLGEGEIMPEMEEMPLLVREAVRTGKAAMLDLHHHDDDASARLGHVAPIHIGAGEQRRIVAVLFVGLRAETYLYPHIQRWPRPSTTGELVLVRRDGHEVIFLNDLRHRRDAAFHMHLPLATPDLPAALAIRAGEQPIMTEGRDYRGVKTLAAARPVPGTSWYLIAKMDETEALAALNHMAFTTGSLVALALAVTIALLVALWHRQRLIAAEAEAAFGRALKASEEHYRVVFEKSRVPMLLIDPKDGVIVSANQAAHEFYGYDTEQLGRMRITDINTLSPGEVEAEMEQANRESRNHFFFRHRLANGDIRDVEVHSGPLDIDGRRLLYSIVLDISERKHIERELQALNRDFVTLLENTTDFIYFKDKNSRFRFCSQTLAAITGHRSWRDMIGKHDLEVFPTDLAQIYFEEERPVFQNGTPLLNRIDPYVDEHGMPGWVSTNKWPVFDADRKVIGLFGISRNVSEQMRLEAELRDMAATDFLTGLPNRRHFLVQLEEQIARMERSTSPQTAVMMLDLDYFKKINDTYGHAVGDAVLKHVARCIRGTLRRIDTAGRVGGEEFAIVLPGADLAAALVSAERLRQAVADTPLVLGDGSTIAITVSIGITELKPTDKGVDTPLVRADEALYRAKGGGRNRVVVDDQDK
jgi:diguanylate cyclase (GGDEF)-like protein/PAS domain S-box-containing protein